MIDGDLSPVECLLKGNLDTLAQQIECSSLGENWQGGVILIEAPPREACGKTSLLFHIALQVLILRWFHRVKKHM